jgi:hypothetical protein
LRRRKREKIRSTEDLFALVRALGDDLRAAGEAEKADALDNALSGATSGEILGELRSELRALRTGGAARELALEDRIDELLRALDEALRPRFF